MPAIVDTDDGLFVVKFRGAGQGPLALVAEIVVGELARLLGLPIPDLALVDVDAAFGASEPDPEIQDLLRASHGTNVGIRYLEGAFNFDPGAAGDLVSPELAAEIVWLDAFATNPDRTARNPNLLIQDRTPWLIDHGAALYHHHDWSRVDDARVVAPFARLGDHVLLAVAGDLAAADRRLAARIGPGTFAGLLAAVPDEWISAEHRPRYVDYLERRFAARAAVVDAAMQLQLAVRARVDTPRSYRR